VKTLVYEGPGQVSVKKVQRDDGWAKAVLHTAMAEAGA